MAFLPSPEKFTNFLLGAYAKVIGPLPVFGSARELAENHCKNGKDINACVSSLIRCQCAKAANNGFWLGLPGGPFLPVAVPVDIAQSMYVQLRMVAAIAHLYGHDIKSDQARALALACLCGGKVTDILRSAGIRFGRKIAVNLIKSLSGEAINAVNRAVGVCLVSKFGGKGLINLGKAVPVAGALIGGAFNGIGTYAVGNAARSIMAAR